MYNKCIPFVINIITALRVLRSKIKKIGFSLLFSDMIATSASLLGLRFIFCVIISDIRSFYCKRTFNTCKRVNKTQKLNCVLRIARPETEMSRCLSIR